MGGRELSWFRLGTIDDNIAREIQGVSPGGGIVGIVPYLLYHRTSYCIGLMVVGKYIVIFIVLCVTVKNIFTACK